MCVASRAPIRKSRNANVSEQSSSCTRAMVSTAQPVSDTGKRAAGPPPVQHTYCTSSRLPELPSWHLDVSVAALIAEQRCRATGTCAQ